MLNMDSKVSNDVIGLDEEDQFGQPEEAVADKPQVAPTFAERAKGAVAAAQEKEGCAIFRSGTDRMEDRPGEKISVLARLHEKQTHQAERTKAQPAQKRSHGQEI